MVDSGKRPPYDAAARLSSDKKAAAWSMLTERLKGHLQRWWDSEDRSHSPHNAAKSGFASHLRLLGPKLHRHQGLYATLKDPAGRDPGWKWVEAVLRECVPSDRVAAEREQLAGCWVAAGIEKNVQFEHDRRPAGYLGPLRMPDGSVRRALGHQDLGQVSKPELVRGLVDQVQQDAVAQAAMLERTSRELADAYAQVELARRDGDRRLAEVSEREADRLKAVVAEHRLQMLELSRKLEAAYASTTAAEHERRAAERWAVHVKEQAQQDCAAAERHVVTLQARLDQYEAQSEQRKRERDAELRAPALALAGPAPATVTVTVFGPRPPDASTPSAFTSRPMDEPDPATHSPGRMLCWRGQLLGDLYAGRFLIGRTLRAWDRATSPWGLRFGAKDFYEDYIRRSQDPDRRRDLAIEHSLQLSGSDRLSHEHRTGSPFQRKQVSGDCSCRWGWCRRCHPQTRRYSRRRRAIELVTLAMTVVVAVASCLIVVMTSGGAQVIAGSGGGSMSFGLFLAWLALLAVRREFEASISSDTT